MTVFATFIAPDDITLRSVYFFDTSGNETIVTTDPNCQHGGAGVIYNEFQLNSQLATAWRELAFPLPKGTKLYCATVGAAGKQLIGLVYD